MALHRPPPTQGSAGRGPGPEAARGVLVRAVSGSALLVVGLLVTSDSTTRLGVPGYWSWLLTGLQVSALWGAGAGCGWGWPLGAAVQPGWITYGVLTDQLGLVPGCFVSAFVQVSVVVRAAHHTHPRDGRGPGPGRPLASERGRSG